MIKKVLKITFVFLLTITFSFIATSNSEEKILADHTDHAGYINIDKNILDTTYKKTEPYTRYELTSNKYCLSEDIDLGGIYIEIPKGYTVEICMNGHSITALGNSIFDVHGSLKIENCDSSKGGLINYTKGPDGDETAIYVNHPSEPLANDGGSLEFKNIDIILCDDDCVGILNSNILKMRDCSIKTANNAKIQHAIQNEPTGNAYLINTTICDLYTKGGAVLNSGNISVGGITKITNNNGPTIKNLLEVNGNYRGNNVIICIYDDINDGFNGKIYSSDDVPPNLEKTKIGVSVIKTDLVTAWNSGGTFSVSKDLKDCFYSDLDEYVLYFNLNDEVPHFELVSKPQKKEKSEPKDESCEAIIGPNWTWDEELGVCKEVVRNKVGYKIVNTATY